MLLHLCTRLRSVAFSVSANASDSDMDHVQMDTWYYSPYPEPYASLEKLHVCEFCLKYFGKEKTLIRHMAKCEMRHPPGDEIYRSPPEPKSPGYCKTPIAVFEVCGKTNKVRRTQYIIPDSITQYSLCCRWASLGACQSLQFHSLCSVRGMLRPAFCSV
jgi:hypothetical protein